MRISDWSSDVCSSDLDLVVIVPLALILLQRRDTLFFAPLMKHDAGQRAASGVDAVQHRHAFDDAGIKTLLHHRFEAALLHAHNALAGLVRDIITRLYSDVPAMLLVLRLVHARELGDFAAARLPPAIEHQKTEETRV